MFDKITSARWLTAERLESLPPALIFHARPKLATSLSEGRFKFLSCPPSAPTEQFSVIA